MILEPTRTNNGGILGLNWDKNLKTFALNCSQSPLTANFTLPYGFLGVEISTATADVVGRGGGLGLFTFIPLFAYESNIVPSLITLYL